VSDGSASTDNPIFSNNENSLGAASEYNQIASGDINQAVANLHTAENALAAQQAQLTTQQGQAQSQVNAEQAAITRTSKSSKNNRPPSPRRTAKIATSCSNSNKLKRRKRLSHSGEVGGCDNGGGISEFFIFFLRFVLERIFWIDNTAAAHRQPVAALVPFKAAESQIGVPYVWVANPLREVRTPDSTVLA